MEPVTWQPVDPLGEALHFLRMSSVFYTRAEFTAPWGLALPAIPDSLMFHVVTEGECRLEIAGGEDQVLRPGSFMLVPHGQGHKLLSQRRVAAAKLFDLPREQVSERYELLRHGAAAGPRTTMICGAVRFDHPAARHLISLLPRTMTVDAWDAPQAEWLQSSLRLMALEARALRPGGEAVITRLADILVIQTIRSWIETDAAAQAGWLGALRDKQVGRALLRMHREPTRDWSVDSLAREAVMSRSAFAARFSDLVGQTPMRYLTEWRMHTALTWLRESDITLATAADRLGYESEAAFSRAFKRVIGTSPGVARTK